LLSPMLLLITRRLLAVTLMPHDASRCFFAEDMFTRGAIAPTPVLRY